MKKSILLGLGVCALALGGVAALVGQKGAVETKADANITYRFTDASGFGANIYAYAYGDGELKNAAWPGVKLDGSYNNLNQKVYVYQTNVQYEHIIFHNYSNKRAVVDISDNLDHAWFSTDDTGSEKDGQRIYGTGTWTPENQTYYLYDYENYFGGSVKYIGHMSDNSDGKKTALLDTTVVPYTSGQVYSVTVDPMYDQITFQNADGSKIISKEYVNQHPNAVLARWSGEDKTWEDRDTMFAHDWAMNTMRLRVHPQNLEDGDSGDCKSTGEDYFGIATTRFAGLNKVARAKIATTNATPYNEARARLAAWATACGKNVAFEDEGEGEYSIDVTDRANTASGVLSVKSNENALIIGTISLVSLLSIGGLFLLRKRKAE